jgi:hypothetical protein
MAQHVADLCAKDDIFIEWRHRSRHSWCSPESKFIHIAPIKSVISYATALHEIGHIKGRYQHSRREIVRERWAWEWARRNPSPGRRAWNASRARRWNGTSARLGKAAASCLTLRIPRPVT